MLCCCLSPALHFLYLISPAKVSSTCSKPREGTWREALLASTFCPLLARPLSDAVGAESVLESSGARNARPCFLDKEGCSTSLLLLSGWAALVWLLNRYRYGHTAPQRAASLFCLKM